MKDRIATVTRNQSSIFIETNSVIRNTYILLSLSLIFSAACAWFAVISNAPQLGFLSLFVYFGLFFMVNALKDSGAGIIAVFALTGFLGYTLGPLLNFILGNFINGAQLVMTALGLTGLIFLLLSGYALTTRKDFSYMAGFLFAATTVAFVAGIASMFFNIPMLHLMVSGAFAIISSGLILFQTSQIVNGGEKNYILATVSIYVSLYNLFVSLLQILTIFSGRRD